MTGESSMSLDSGKPLGAGSSTDTATRWAIAAFSMLLTTVPFWWVTFPPIVDLPQNVGTTALLMHKLAHPGDPYKIHWWAPMTLSQVYFIAAWITTGRFAAGRVAAAALAAVWVGAIHLLAAAYKRSPASAMIASLLAFNVCLRYGLFNFISGWPAFVLLLIVAPPARRPMRVRDMLQIAGILVLLYMGHALWLAAGIAWLGLWFVLTTVRWREMKIGLATSPREAAMRAVTALAPALPAALWFHSFSHTRFATSKGMVWEHPWSKLSPSVWSALLPGQPSHIKTAAFALLALWLVLGIISVIRGGIGGIDRRLAASAAFMFAMVLFLPESSGLTVLFDKRWLALGPVLLLLALPAPPLGGRSGIVAAGVLACAFTFWTTRNWIRFDREECTGLAESIDALPAGSRLLGLNRIETSRYERGTMFMQSFAYGLAWKDAMINFDFSWYPEQLVVAAPGPHRPLPWTTGLEVNPGKLNAEQDLRWFDYVLVNGQEDVHEKLARLDQYYVPVTHTGRFRLYRSVPGMVWHGRWP